MHVLLTEDQELFRRTVREFAEREIAPVAAECDEAERYPRENVKKMGELGLMGLTIPTEHGGAGAGPVEYALAMEEIARADAAHSVILSVNSSLVCEPILKYGTESQQRQFLSRLASADIVGSFCLSEPQSGSDARHMQTKAKRDGEYYVLNGTKNWISNGGEAGLYLVFAALEDEPEKSAAFLIESWRWGLRWGPKEKKLGIRASSTTQVFLEDCRVPAENRLGEEGDGFKIAMSTLDGGRIGIAAQAVGIAQAAYDAALAYARERQAFGQPISEFQAIQFMLADMHVRIEQSRLLVYQAALLEAKGGAFAKEAAMAKLSASETAMWVTNKAIQIHGGYGYSREYPVQRYYRDAKITEIYEGTSEIQRLVIARQILRGEPTPMAAEEGEPEVRETQTPTLVLPPTQEELNEKLGVRKLHHVAVAVDSVDEALRFYRDTLGLTDITLMTLEDRGLKIGLVKAGLSEIELLEPTNPENTVSRFLDRRGPGLHHVCFEVDDIAASMKHFEGRGGQFLDPVPRPGAVGLVSFMPPAIADGVLVELAQTSGYETEAAEPEPAAETEAVAEETPVIFATPIPRGAGGYSRPGLMAPQPIVIVDGATSAVAGDAPAAHVVTDTPVADAEIEEGPADAPVAETVSETTAESMAAADTVAQAPASDAAAETPAADPPAATEPPASSAGAIVPPIEPTIKPPDAAAKAPEPAAGTPPATRAADDKSP